MSISQLGLAFVAFLLSAAVLRPGLRLLDLGVPDGPHATEGFDTPVIGGIALWSALAVTWLLRPSGIDMPALVLGLIALRLLAAPGERDPRWTNAAMLLVDLIVCAALLQMRDGEALDLRSVLTILSGVALLQGVFRLRSLDGLGALVLCIALAALASLTSGSARWLASTGAAAATGLLLLNLPLRFNRVWRIRSGQGGAALLALVFGVAAMLARSGTEATSPGPMHLLWLLPLPCCELLAVLARRPTSHQRLLDAGFSVTAIFLLYAAMSALPALVLIASPGLPPPALLASVFIALVLLWFVVVWQAPRLMWLLPWRLRRIDVVHKD